MLRKPVSSQNFWKGCMSGNFRDTKLTFNTMCNKKKKKRKGRQRLGVLFLVKRSTASPLMFRKKTKRIIRKLVLVLIIPYQIFFSFSSDKDRRTDSRIRRKTKHSAGPRRATTNSQDPGFDSRRGCAVFFRLIRLPVLIPLSELKEKRI